MSSVSASDEPQHGAHAVQGAILGGTYRVGKLLGRGPLGAVFEAEQVRLHRRVALKLLAPHLVGNASALAAFQREAEIISQLQHPNIVQLVDADTTDSGEPYMVLEYLSGQTLAGVLEQYGRLDVQKAARIVHQVACGLHAAHRASVVHGDLRPSNVFLVDVPGEGTLVKVLNFGLGQFMDSARRLTGEYDIVERPDYMPPEQALGESFRVDPRSDQYSLAVIAYEAISGHTPFVGRNLDEVIQRVVANDPVPLDRFVPEVPSAVGQVLRRGMAKDAADRFPSVLEFAQALLAAAGCTLPAGDARAALRPLLEDPPTPPPLSFIAPRPDGRYHTQELAAESRPTDPAGPYSETEPPGPEPATEPPSAPPTSFPPAPSSASAVAARLPDVAKVIEQAREAFGLGDLDLAVTYAENAVVLGAVLGGRARDRVESASPLLESIFLARLGSLETRLLERGLPAGRAQRISPEQAFLLSRLDVPATVEEVLDLSPLPRRETLQHLVALLRQGLIGPL